MSFDKGNSLDCLDVHAHGTSGSKRWHKPATVVTVDQCGEKRIMKTYPLLFFPLSYCFRLLARHEYKMLKKAEELVFTPNQVRWNANGGGGVCYQYLKGFSLKELQENGEIPKEFFVKLYAAVQQLHQTGMVHSRVVLWLADALVIAIGLSAFSDNIERAVNVPLFNIRPVYFLLAWQQFNDIAI
ncbi:hypothetical protein [Marinobacter piscensis]|uniref:hypothetical protein n=1 Tax=Marinobacter piscensis TaxID=1562308 RepID=UPI0011A7B9D9|nr:hypothetical protein [Marinobacter piscensis]